MKSADISVGDLVYELLFPQSPKHRKRKAQLGIVIDVEENFYHHGAPLGVKMNRVCVMWSRSLQLENLPEVSVIRACSTC